MEFLRNVVDAFLRYFHLLPEPDDNLPAPGVQVMMKKTGKMARTIVEEADSFLRKWACREAEAAGAAAGGAAQGPALPFCVQLGQRPSTRVDFPEGSLSSKKCAFCQCAREFLTSPGLTLPSPYLSLQTTWRSLVRSARARAPSFLR